MSKTKPSKTEFIDIPNNAKFKHDGKTYYKTSNQTGVSRFSHNKVFKSNEKVEIITK